MIKSVILQPSGVFFGEKIGFGEFEVWYIMFVAVVLAQSEDCGSDDLWRFDAVWYNRTVLIVSQGEAANVNHRSSHATTT